MPLSVTQPLLPPTSSFHAVCVDAIPQVWTDAEITAAGLVAPRTRAGGWSGRAFRHHTCVWGVLA